MATPTELVEAHYDARVRRDVEQAMALFAPGVVVHMPEVIPFADLDGVDRLAAVLEFALHVTDGTYAAALVGVLGGGDIVVAVVAATGTRDGAPFGHHQAWVYRFEGSVVVEAWVHIDLPDEALRTLYGTRSDVGAATDADRTGPGSAGGAGD